MVTIGDDGEEGGGDREVEKGGDNSGLSRVLVMI